MKVLTRIALLMLITLPSLAQMQSRIVRGYANQQLEEYLANDRAYHGSGAAGAPAININTSTRFIMEVKVLNNVVADQQVAIFNITQIGETAEEAERLSTQRIEGFKEDLIALGVTEDDMFQDLIAFAPYYSEKSRLFSTTKVKKPAGFELQVNMHIRYSDSKLINRILSIAATHEIYDLVRVEYYVEDIEQVYHDMRVKAMEEVTHRQEAYKELGMDLTQVYRKLAEGHRAYMPQERYLDYTGVTLIAKEDKTEGGNEDDDYRNPQTAFYAPLSYKDYDVVINSVILEPVVQFTYTLKIDFEFPYLTPEEEDEEGLETAALEKEPAEPIKQFYLITPSGELKFITEGRG
ncbi:MAG: SIMPL domain-containing protein [Bacteroidota bacterium]